MARPKKETTESNNELKFTSKDILENILEENKEDHFNFDADIDYKVSLGSMQLDIATNGGLPPGLHRFSGAAEGGKTSETLEIMRNLFKAIPNSKGFYIKAEGRLSPEMQARSGIKFVKTSKEWEPGTCFIFECNITEVVFETMKGLVRNNPEKSIFMFVIDSADALCSKLNMEKTMGEARQPGTGAKLIAEYLQQASLGLTKYGHLCICISQMRDEVILDQYAKRPQRQTSSSGGNAIQHYTNFVFEFLAKNQGDMILANDKLKIYDPKNKIIGHNAKVVLKKSGNEKTFQRIEYPIKYGVVGGSSIWVEREILPTMILLQLVEKNTAWYTVNNSVLEQAKEKGLEVPERFQGEESFVTYLTENQPVTEFLYQLCMECALAVQNK